MVWGAEFKILERGRDGDKRDGGRCVAGLEVFVDGCDLCIVGQDVFIAGQGCAAGVDGVGAGRRVYDLRFHVTDGGYSAIGTGKFGRRNAPERPQVQREGGRPCGKDGKRDENFEESKALAGGGMFIAG